MEGGWTQREYSNIPLLVGGLLYTVRGVKKGENPQDIKLKMSQLHKVGSQKKLAPMPKGVYFELVTDLALANLKVGLLQMYIIYVYSCSLCRLILMYV
jgi:hypothetical protein